MDKFSFKDVINGSENYWNEKGKNLKKRKPDSLFFRRTIWCWEK